MSEREEAALKAAQAGDVDGLEVIYRALHPRVLAFLRSQGAGEAEDLASDVFLNLARALPKFKGDWSGLTALTFTIARRRLSDDRRKRGRRRTDAVRADDLESYLAPDEGPSGDDDVRRLIDRLPPDQAEVIVLRVIADLSVEQTAQILGKRAGAIRALQLRALRRLAKEFPDYP